MGPKVTGASRRFVIKSIFVGCLSLKRRQILVAYIKAVVPPATISE